MFLTGCDIHPFTTIKDAVSVSNSRGTSTSHTDMSYIFIITTQRTHLEQVYNAILITAIVNRQQYTRAKIKVSGLRQISYSKLCNNEGKQNFPLYSQDDQSSVSAT